MSIEEINEWQINVLEDDSYSSIEAHQVRAILEVAKQLAIQTELSAKFYKKKKAQRKIN